MKKIQSYKKLVSLMLLTCLLFNIQAVVYAEEDTNEIIVSGYKISEEFEVVTAENEIKDILVDEELIDIIDKESIKNIVEVNPDMGKIEIKTEDNLLELEALPEQVAIVTNDELIINVNIDSEVVNDVSPVEILEIIEENDLNGFETITIDAAEEIEYEDDILYSIQEVNDLESEMTITDNIEEFEQLEEEMLEQLEESETVIEDETTIGIEPQWKLYDLYLTYTTSRTYGSQYLYKDVFIASAARGETYTLTKKFSSSISLSLESGSVFNGTSAKSGLTSSVSYSVAKSHKYSGPPESSIYNSREYRVKFYAKKCNVTQKVKGYPSKHVTTYKGTYRVPVKYLSYSLNKRV